MTARQQQAAGDAFRITHYTTPFCKRACLTEEIRELADIVSRHGAVADHGVDLLAEFAVRLRVLEDEVGGEREHPWNAISLMAVPLGES